MVKDRFTTNGGVVIDNYEGEMYYLNSYDIQKLVIVMNKLVTDYEVLKNRFESEKKLLFDKDGLKL